MQLLKSPLSYPIDKEWYVPSLEEAIKRYGYPCPSSFPCVKTDYFKFEIAHESRKTNARVGKILTPHGIIDTPGFVPVATNSALKHVPFEMAQSKLETQLIFANSYHLMIHPSPEIISQAGGIHKFCGYNRPMITDSGGFQIFSMNNMEAQDELKGKCVSEKYKKSSLIKKISEEGVSFRSYRNGELLYLTPQSSVKSQKMIGADIIIPLDILLPDKVNERKLLASFHRTHRWEAQCLAEHLKDLKNQAMYSVIHGGKSLELRKLSIDYLTQLPFQGIAIGGSLGENISQMNQLVQDITSMLPTSFPIHLLGIGDEKSIYNAVKHGVDTFDSSYPTKAGRHGNLLSKNGIINIKKNYYKDKHDIGPVVGCECPTCTNVSAAYLHHLYTMNEPISQGMGVVHNIYYMMKFMESIRREILEDGL